MANWIAGAIKKKGALHRALGVPAGKVIASKALKAAIKGGGVNAKRAQLALTLRKFK